VGNHYGWIKEMKKCFIIINALLVITALFISSPDIFAGQRKSPITPYGDSCKECGRYGTCDSQMKPKDARKAISDYYKKKGLDAEVKDVRGRFIKATIKDKGKTVDVIIFDRRTGRIRSIY
jgi:hypothetical protein